MTCKNMRMGLVVSPFIACAARRLICLNNVAALLSSHANYYIPLAFDCFHMCVKLASALAR